MSEKTPEHRDELSPWRRGEDSLFESVGDLMREVPPPAPPPDSHIAMLNRRVRDHIEQDRGMRRTWTAVLDALRVLWYQPRGVRALALCGAAAALVAGVMIGDQVGRSAERETLSELGAIAFTGPRVSESQPSDITLDSIQQVSVRAPQRQDLFPSVYVMANQPAQSGGTGSQWVSLGDNPMLRDLGADAWLERLSESMPSFNQPVVSLTEDPALTELADRIVTEDMLGRMRQLKLDLYLAGERDVIGEIQEVEEMFHQILASQAARTFSAQDAEAQALFAQAEGHLINRDYRRAEEAFNRLAHSQAPRELIALSWYHLGNIYYDFHGDFAGARQCYQRALVGDSMRLFPESIVTRLQERLTLLNDAAASQYRPVELLRQAEAAPPDEAVTLFGRLLREFPTSEAVSAGINSLAERAMRETPGHPDLPHRVIALLREYQTLADARFRTLAQIRLADVIYFGIQDYPQALIEYGKIELEGSRPELAAMVQDRIAQILDERVGP